MRCKVGDLVMIVSDGIKGHNIGRFGTVLECDFIEGLAACLVQPQHTFVSCRGLRVGELEESSLPAWTFDSWLTPIRPLPDDEELEDKAPADHKELQDA